MRPFNTVIQQNKISVIFGKIRASVSVFVILGEILASVSVLLYLFVFIS